MGVYNHADYDWVGVVYPDGDHGSYDQAELDLFDSDKRYNSLREATTASVYNSENNILIEAIGTWTTPDTEAGAFSRGIYNDLYSFATCVFNVRDSAKWNSVWNPNPYKLLVPSHALIVQGSNTPDAEILIDGIVITAAVPGAYGMYSTGSSGIQFNITFKNSVFSGVPDELSAASKWTLNPPNLTLHLENCIFHDYSSYAISGPVPGTMKNCTFYRCYYRNDYGASCSVENMTANNCVFYEMCDPDANSGNQAITPTVGSLSDYNATNMSQGLSNNTVYNIVDPFLGAGTRDFRIDDTSPLYDAGTILAEITHDIVGVSRPQGTFHDIGAFEYDAGGQTGVPVPIQLLNLVIGSRCTVEKTSDGTPILIPTEAVATSIVDTFAYLADTPVLTKVRKSSPGDPVRYRAYKAPGVITSNGLMVYVDQQEDEVLN